MMRNWIGGAVVLATLLTAPQCLSAEHIESIAPAAGYEQLAQQLRSFIRTQVDEKDLPAFSIALVDGDKTVWAEGFGYQDADKKRPATASTVYRVGSISKLFTDIAVMQLVERGELSLDAPITECLPNFAPQNPHHTPITLRQLMSHQSGMVREPPVGHYFDPTEPTLQETVESLNDTALVYPPNSKTKYSNAAIAVVGYALQKKLGVSYSQQIDNTILQPLEMTGSSFELTSQVEQNLATAWMWTYDGRRFEAPKFSLGTAPAGNLYSTVLDLSKFLVAILGEGHGPGGAILQPETLALMTAPQKNADGEPQPFGIGFHIAELDGHRQIGHGGAVYGFSTQLEALPDEKLGVVTVSSLDGSNGLASRVAAYALRLLLARKEGSEPPAIEGSGPVAADRAQAVVGRYQHGNRIIELSELGGKLFLRRGSFQFELRADADGFVVDDVFGYGPKITRDGADALLIGEERYERVADEKPADIPSRWQGLIGEYGWDHNTLYILEDRNRLWALIEWFYYYPLEELGDDEFAFPDYGLYHGEKLIFSRDDDGQATKVVAAEVAFERREVGVKDGETFRITPVKPIDELRHVALAAEPPAESGDFRQSDLVELTSLDSTIKLDIRYASTNNFTGAVFYKQPRAFMQRLAAEAVVRANQRLKKYGLGLLVHDAYRPWHVTKMFWDATPAEMKDFVANPASGSRHNRGCAVDLTLYDLNSGEPIEMVAGYDEFSTRSFPAYPGGTARQRWHRELLRRVMQAEGFTVYEYEWWHFDYQDWSKYRIHNVTFEELLSAGDARQPSSNGALQFEMQRTVAASGYDGKMCWVHARAGAIPAAYAGDSNAPAVVMTLQKLLLTGSDVFYALNEMRSDDLGARWSGPKEHESFARKRIDDRTEMTVCDFTPKWHAATKKLLGTGHTVWYRDNKVMHVRPRATAYAVYDPEEQTWSAWRELKMPDDPKFANCGAGSVQRLDLENGDILLPVYFKQPDQQQYSVTVCRCTFDGKELQYVEHGNEMTVDVKRGFAEPSLTSFAGRYYLTLRNDEHGYVTSSDDGLHFAPPRQWTFDDGAELGNYNTQQHWITHSDGLYLAYTRRGADNDHVFRHRAPLFIARVDPQKLAVIRGSEQILVPQRGARLGNFGVVDVNSQESWVTVTEWMQPAGVEKYGSDNSVFVVKLKWSRPNRRFDIDTAR